MEQGGLAESSHWAKATVPDLNIRLAAHYIGESEVVAEMWESNILKLRKIIASSHPAVKNHGTRTLFLPNIHGIEVKLHDLIAHTKELHTAIDSMISKISNFKDLRKVEDHLRVFYKNDTNMPFFTMGDGTKAVIISTLAVHAINEGTIIMEEPENFLHPGLLNRFVNELILATKSDKMQIFLSTHSMELLEFLLTEVADLDISIVQLNEFEGEIDAQVLNQTKALKKLNELGMDLRDI